ncbi:hypothetical protein H4R18_003303 [Coemansia javaensis]|uniref:CSD domain-containing protein n=1 Tax=Coemansia javaensis TaxID=2761396 RepID=A0A9W8LGI9_9FUNG|nr:hypothetical protein H4R18_003303 [Coemansia javaensis]
MPPAKSGHVKFFSSQKGYGFIIPNEPIDGHVEVFVHHTVIHNSGGFKSLAENEPVEFEVARGPKGLQATWVTGPGGAYVRGDPYSRQRNRSAHGARAAAVGAGAGIAGTTPPALPAATAAYIPYSYALPAGYSGGYPYGQSPCTPYSQAVYATPPPPPLPPATHPQAAPVLSAAVATGPAGARHSVAGRSTLAMPGDLYGGFTLTPPAAPGPSSLGAVGRQPQSSAQPPSAALTHSWRAVRQPPPLPD